MGPLLLSVLPTALLALMLMLIPSNMLTLLGVVLVPLVPVTAPMVAREGAKMEK